MQTLTMTAVKLFPSGAWQVSAIVGNHRVVRTYYGYPKREALRLFRKEVRHVGSNR